MFALTVDNEIQLALCNRLQAPQLYALVNEQKSYLSQWLPWPDQTKNLDDYLRFVATSLHRYADNTGMVCFIYQDEPVGCAGFNVINHTLKKAEIGYWLSLRHQDMGHYDQGLPLSCRLRLFSAWFGKGRDPGGGAEQAEPGRVRAPWLYSGRNHYSF